MKEYEVHVGYDGKCVTHHLPTVFRRTDEDMRYIDAPSGQMRFVNVIKVHCAAGHTYLAVDLDESITDPFDQQTTDSIVAEEF